MFGTSEQELECEVHRGTDADDHVTDLLSRQY